VVGAAASRAREARPAGEHGLAAAAQTGPCSRPGAVVRNLPFLGWRGRVVSVRADGPADVILILRGGIQVRWGEARGTELLRQRDGGPAPDQGRLLRCQRPATAVTGRPVRAVGRPSARAPIVTGKPLFATHLIGPGEPG